MSVANHSELGSFGKVGWYGREAVAQFEWPWGFAVPNFIVNKGVRYFYRDCLRNGTTIFRKREGNVDE
jgi:hypothetical protein